MKRLVCLLFCIFLFGLLVSCIIGGRMYVFDKNVPAEQSAILRISPHWTITSYNGLDVDIKTGSGMSFTGFTIPAGNTVFVMDLHATLYDGIYQARDIVLRYNFEAGEDYLIWFYWVKEDGTIPRVGTGGGTLGLAISKNKDRLNALFFVPMEFRRSGESEPRILE